ncbi:SagB family peptide dehydrogenase [Metabacillus sp. RGM 3146]|uniref:SagB family peptide dehydrogenase n=1 Tax=Metabacillus sp. RGM 3146 TaxID=3401092 RepID=UPI003B9B092B
MNLEKFLHNLHLDTDQAAPPDWEPDWEDAPLPYKLYRGLPSFSFSADVPLSLQKQTQLAVPDVKRMGDFLWYTYGLSAVSQILYSFDESEQTEIHQTLRRYVPSGGGLYPNELYLYLKLKELPAGVYHYDTAHHRLILLREGNYDSYLSGCLGDRFDLSSSFGTAIVSTMFWKNFFKYNEFSYRLQGLDAGVLLGQMQETAESFGFSAAVTHQFMDRAVNHLLGLNVKEETVYAVIPLSAGRVKRKRGREVLAEELCRKLPVIRHEHYVRSKRVLPYPALQQISEAAEMDRSQSFRELQPEKDMKPAGQVIFLPGAGRLSYDLAAACRERHSPEMDFCLRKIPLEHAGSLLYEAGAAFPYQNDLDHADFSRRISIYACFYNVDGIPNGAYAYNSREHSLRGIAMGDHRFYLQDAMSVNNLNLYQVPITLHLAGDREHMINELGYRGYRIQQMEAGMQTQKILLAAAAMGMGGHPLLGFDVNKCDELYGLKREGKTCLIQIPVGPYQKRVWLKGSLRG